MRKKEEGSVYVRVLWVNYIIALQSLFIYLFISNLYIKTNYKAILYTHLYIFSHHSITYAFEYFS